MANVTNSKEKRNAQCSLNIKQTQTKLFKNFIKNLKGEKVVKS